jgi:Protein of unknown function (DUF2510)
MEGPSEREPGWEPDRRNPNLQRYWDGSDWTASRRWVSGEWINGGPVALVSTPVTPGGARFHYAPMRPAVATVESAPRETRIVRAGHLGLFVCSILLILGSFTPWVGLSLAGHNVVSAAGTDSSVSQLIGVNGWITFSAGLLLFMLTCMIIDSGEPIFRSLTLVLALAAAGVAAYDLVRILQTITRSAPTSAVSFTQALQPGARIGWGLMVVVVGGVGALVFACSLRPEPPRRLAN